MLAKLQDIKNKSKMNIKSGRVMMEVTHRDWLIKTVEDQHNQIKKLQKT